MRVFADFFGNFLVSILSEFFSQKNHGICNGIFLVENIFDKMAKIRHPKKSLIVVYRNQKGKK